MDLNHFLKASPAATSAIARPTAICAPSPPGGPASGAHRSECGGRSDGRRSTCPRALGRGGLWRARERWRRWPRPAGRTPRSACRAPPPFGPVRPVRKEVGGSFRIYLVSDRDARAPVAPTRWSESATLAAWALCLPRRAREKRPTRRSNRVWSSDWQKCTASAGQF